LGSDSDAAGVLARAFGDDDPFWSFVEPDEGARTRKLEAWFPVAVRYARRYGTVDHTGAGAALWLPPERYQMTTWRMLRTGMLRTPRILGRPAFKRLNEASHALDGARARTMPAGADYLWILGVDPPQQGRGQGAAAIGVGLARVDAAPRPVYLETYRERNLAFYARHGFDVVAKEEPATGPPFWTLVRPAR
jgi:GNAT superfamily N-acetyltransferase